jgi:glycosyltransferase involved in cell wall biosynthesis
MAQAPTHGQNCAMRSLVIAPQPFFTPRGTPFSVYYRTLVMAELGVQVDLLCYGEGSDVDVPNARIIRIPRFRFLGPTRIGPSPQKAFLDIFMLLWTIGLLLRRRYDYVHAHEESVFWCRFLKPVFRFKLAYDMHSSLPQQLTNFAFTQNRLVIGAFGWLERTALKASEAVITICPDLRDYALRSGVDPERLFLIENSIFDDVRLARNATEIAQEAAGSIDVPPAAGPRVVYAGTFEAYQGLDILVRAFGLVLPQRPDAQLLMVGGRPDQIEQLKRLAEEVGASRSCLFTGRVAKSEAMRLADSADVLVSPRSEGTNTPLKVYEQLASGKPLVATNIWSHTQVLNDEVCFLVDPQPESMAQGLLQAMTDPDAARQRAQAARQLYEAAYSRPVYEQKMRDFLALLAR